MWKSKLKVQYIHGTKNPKKYVLLEPLVWDNGDQEIAVPIGFKTDFASTPKWLHWLWKPQGRYSKASVVHDFMYSVNWYTRLYADITYKKIMLHDKVKKVTANLFYLGVRLFGGSRYGTK